MKLLVIDTSYNLKAIKEKKLYEPIFSRDLNGFFEKVWSVHPFADITNLSNTKNNYGSPEITELSNNHSFIEGKMGKFFFFKKNKVS